MRKEENERKGRKEETKHCLCSPELPQIKSCLINLTNNEHEIAMEKGLRREAQRGEEVWGRHRMGRSSSSAPALLSQCLFFPSLPIPVLYFRVPSLSPAAVESAEGLAAAQCQRSGVLPCFQKSPFILPPLAIFNTSALIVCIEFF